LMFAKVENGMRQNRAKFFAPEKLRKNAIFKNK